MAKCTAIVNDEQFEVRLDEDGSFFLSEKLLDASARMLNGLVHLRIGGQTMIAYSKWIGENSYEVWIGHHVIHVRLEDEKSRLERKFWKATASHLGIQTVRAPMPGLVTAVNVQQGNTIEVGKSLLILEAMKMENEIRSPIAGKVKTISILKGNPVEKGQALMTIEQEAL